MKGVAIFLTLFFVACWIAVIAYHTGLGGEQSLTIYSRTMPIAYTGAALSVCGLVAAIVAGVLNE